MFKTVCLVFIAAALVNRYVVTKRVLAMDKSRGTVYAGWITKLVFLFYVLIFAGPAAELFLVERTVNYWVSGAALLGYGGGMFLWLWAIRSLGRYWSTEIEIREEQTIVKKGPYRYMRHPHYLFLFCEVFGIPLIANAYYSLALVAALYVPLISLRIILEERALVAKFGDQYRQYKREVWGLLPVPLFKEGVKP